MLHRFLTTLLGFIVGCGIMSVIYDMKLISHNMGFTSQFGMNPEGAVVVKAAFGLMALVGAVVCIVKDPPVEETIIKEIDYELPESK